MTYGDPQDLAVIDAYMRTAATRAVADAIRAAQPQLALLDGHEAPPALPMPGRNLYDASTYPDEMRQVVARETVAPEQPFPRERVQRVTVRPVEGEPRVDRPDWLQRHWPQLVIWLAVAAAAGIGLWLLILAIAAALAALSGALAALSAALTALLFPLGVIAVVLLLIGLCCRGGSSGGGGFSGTVQGRWWHG